MRTLSKMEKMYIVGANPSNRSNPVGGISNCMAFIPVFLCQKIEQYQLCDDLIELRNNGIF